MDTHMILELYMTNETGGTELALVGFEVFVLLFEMLCVVLPIKGEVSKAC
jgi:hypothetical protein